MLFRTSALRFSVFLYPKLKVHFSSSNSSITKLKTDTKFETVFSFPYIKYVAVFNRLKLYQIVGTAATVPICTLMETMQYLPSDCSFIAGYIGVTGFAVLSLFSYFSKNIIGFIYISEDNNYIKISSVDYWGRRKDRIIPTEEWIPLSDMESKTSDAFYLSPKLTDGTSMKLIVKLGYCFNKEKMGQFLE